MGMGIGEGIGEGIGMAIETGISIRIVMVIGLEIGMDIKIRRRMGIGHGDMNRNGTRDDHRHRAWRKNENRNGNIAEQSLPGQLLKY